MRWITLSLIIIMLPLQDTEWRLDKDKNNIKVYTRKLEGHPVRQFKVESNSTADLNKFDDIMRQIDQYENWMPDIELSEILEKPDENSYIYRMVINAPFPVSDRDVVAKMEISYPDEFTVRINHEGLKDYLPEDEDYVRIQSFSGYWEFKRQDDKTMINNQFISDPGGSMPTWVVNSFLASNPYNTVKKLKESVE